MSRNIRGLNPIKFGASKIALNAEKMSNYELGLKIQPIGLTYLSFTQFHTTATIHLGEPFDVSPYFEQMKNDERAATAALSADIEQRIRELIVVIEQEEHTSLANKIAAIYSSRGTPLNDFEKTSEGFHSLS